MSARRDVVQQVALVSDLRPDEAESVLRRCCARDTDGDGNCDRHPGTSGWLERAADQLAAPSTSWEDPPVGAARVEGRLVAADSQLAPPVCPYCPRSARLASGADVYPHRQDLHHKWFWVCDGCDARVGCHDGTQVPLGTLAGPALRQARWRAHAALDRLWKRELGGTVSRAEAYAWLAQALGVAPDACHVGMFDEEWCQRVVDACAARSEDRCARVLHETGAVCGRPAVGVEVLVRGVLHRLCYDCLDRWSRSTENK